MRTVTGNHTIEWLQDMQSMSLPEKIILTKARIQEAIISCKGKCYVAFSGGKDSGVLLHLVSQVWKNVYPDRPLVVIFADTGNEFLSLVKFVSEYVEFIQNTVEIEINLLKAKPTFNGKATTFMHVCKEIGYPVVSKKISNEVEVIRKNFKSLGYSKLRAKQIIESLDENSDQENYKRLRELGFNKTVCLHLTGINSAGRSSTSWKLSSKWRPLIYAPFKCSAECCTILKKNPSSNLAKTLGLTLSFIGEMADDGYNRRMAYLQTGCNAFSENGVGKSKPMGFWTEQDVLMYYEKEGIPHADVYGKLLKHKKTGELKFSRMPRTGCKLCLFGIQFDTDRIDTLYGLEPKIVDYAMKPISESGLGYNKVLKYIESNCGINLELPQKYTQKEKDK